MPTVSRRKKPTAAEWLKANAARYPTPLALAHGAMKALKRDRSGHLYASAREAWDDAHPDQAGSTRTGTRRRKSVRVDSPANDRLTEDDLRAKYSTEYKIRTAAQQIPKGSFEREADFIERLGIKGPWRGVAERKEFDRYRGKAPGGIVYWGHPERIIALKDEGVLSDA